MLPRAFRVAALLEGTTLILLLVLAVPLKYVVGDPFLVKMIGPAHGLAFLGYQYCLLRYSLEGNWGLPLSLKLCLASFVPGGTFLALRQRSQT